MLEKLSKLINYTILKNNASTPRSLIFFVTSRCNSRCRHCFYWQNLNKNNDLSLEEIEKISKSLGPVDSLNISGGEPFLRDDLPEIVNLFYQHNGLRVVTIPTNGILTEKIIALTSRILSYSKNKTVTVSFSLDGTEEKHNNLRGIPDNYQTVMKTYKEMTKLKETYKNLNLQINSVVTGENYLDIKDLITEVREKMPQVDYMSLSLLRGVPKDSSLNLPSIENIKSVEKYRDSVLPPKSVIVRLVNFVIFRLKINTLKKQKQVIPCEAGRQVGVITENGDVRLCELLPPIGNLKEKSFKEIWNSDKAKNERKKIKNGECWCTHECFLFPSLVAHPLRGIKEII